MVSCYYTFHPLPDRTKSVLALGAHKLCSAPIFRPPVFQNFRAILERSPLYSTPFSAYRDERGGYRLNTVSSAFGASVPSH